ncbi:porin [Burkholderia pseudomultivorans]|uniref:porin n=1 Tax=Burkholderia pseudomultivorans TaxID=1207504 RepID=UPI00075B042B|nr:porin [Burkholderia pseudomultivorans]KWI54705.1 porin [Burkholderia pseudomultivorans]
MKMAILGVVTLGVLANVAHAQSSVTLYGIIDEGINFNSNASGHRLYNLSSGIMQGSRLGFRGSEDLGGGLKAVFVIENGFDVNGGKLGQGGLMFGRQAYVGLSGVKFGSITLGRQYDSVVDYVGQLEAGGQWGGNIAAHPGDLDNFNNTYRTNNTLKYTSATYGGFKFGGTYSLGGIAGQLTQNQIWSLGAGYTNGPLALGVGYLNARTPSNVGGLFGNSTSTTAAAIVTTPVYSGYTSANTYQIIGAGGAYTVGAATIGVTYSNVKFGNLGANGASSYQRGDSVTFNNAEINLKYQVTPTLLAGMAFDYTRGSDVTLANGSSSAGARYYQGALGIDYFMSKRTDVYLIGVYQKASGASSTGLPAVAAINGVSASSGDRQAVVRIGMRHKF